MWVDSVKVEFKNCTFIGTAKQLKEVIEDCYIIPKENIHNITEQLQGVKNIVTKPIFE